MCPKLLRVPKYEQGTKDDREQEGKIKSKTKYNLLNKIMVETSPKLKKEMGIQTRRAFIFSNRWPEKKLTTT